MIPTPCFMAFVQFKKNNFFSSLTVGKSAVLSIISFAPVTVDTSSDSTSASSPSSSHSRSLQKTPRFL